MGKGACTYKRCVRIRVQVAHGSHEPRGIGQARKLLIGNAINTEFQLEGRDDRAKIGVTAPLAISVDRALYVRCSRAYRSDCAGNGEFAVVMGMDPDHNVSCERTSDLPYDPLDVGRQGPAICVAQHECLGTGRRSRLKARPRVRFVVLPSIEEVFSVIEHPFSIGTQETDRIPDHCQVFIEGNPEDIAHLHRIVLAYDGHH